MALGSIKLTIEGYNMFSMLQSKEEEKTWTLGPLDRCDRCSAEALVKVSGISGELFFCGHHYNKIMDNAVGYDSMMKFAISIIDEREKISL
jgi:hypothetical protein